MSSSGWGCSATVSASIQNTRTWGPRFLGNNLEFDQGQHQPLMRGIGSFLEEFRIQTLCRARQHASTPGAGRSSGACQRRLYVVATYFSFFPCFSLFSFFALSPKSTVNLNLPVQNTPRSFMLLPFNLQRPDAESPSDGVFDTSPVNYRRYLTVPGVPGRAGSGEAVG